MRNVQLGFIRSIDISTILNKEIYAVYVVTIYSMVKRVNYIFN
jgi:hypothetical protein